MNCKHCGKPLTGTLDTYGEVGGELCADCYFVPEVFEHTQPSLSRLSLEDELREVLRQMHEERDEAEEEYHSKLSDIDNEYADEIERLESEIAALKAQKDTSTEVLL